MGHVEKRLLAALALSAPAGLWWGAGHAAAGAADIVLAPHRAVYDLKLEAASPGSGVADVSGRIVYELTGSACEGYAQSMRFLTVTVTQDGETRLTDLRNSSWESVPPRHLRFSATIYQNEQAAEQTQGSAKRDASGAVAVELARPAKKKLALAKDVYFPVQHAMAIIETARRGGRMLSADLYDGSETGEKVYATSTAIGLAVVAGAQKTLAHLKGGDALDHVPSWPVSISYFAKGGPRGDAVPLYEMSFRFHENGVTSSLKIDHGEFAIRGNLTDLAYLEASPCAPAKP